MTRRRILVALASLAVATLAWLGPGRRWAAPPAEPPEDLGALFASAESLRRIGAAALAEHGDLADAEAIARELGRGSLWRRGEWSRERFAEKTREDFRAGRVRSVRGWLLSETEVKLAALAALRSSPS